MYRDLVAAGNKFDLRDVRRRSGLILGFLFQLRVRFGLLVVSLAALWVPTLYLFAGQWSGYPEYHYGWAVPALSVSFLWRRASSVPARSEVRLPQLARTAVTIFAALLLPLYIVQDANPIWRAASWLLALCLVGISILLFYLLGGAAWARHFRAPFLFLLVAVPWPSPVEAPIIDFLTHANLRATIEALVLVGIPAAQHGNIIELVSGLVTIDEACSGIRSMQANLMLALALGELYRLRTAPRCALVLYGLFTGLALNLARTLSLTAIAAQYGLDTMALWHDRIGVCVLLGCFGLLWFLARAEGVNARSIDAPSGTDPVQTIAASTHVIHHRRQLLLMLALWACFVPVASELWFRAHQQPVVAGRAWSVSWPPKGLPFGVPAQISEGARALLRPDQGGTVRWRDSGGALWQMFYFRWLPAGNIFRRVEVQFAKNHRPERCLPASGRILTEQKVTHVEFAGVQVPFRFYRFQDGALPLHIYFSVWDEGNGLGTLGNMRSDPAERLRAAWRGNRASGQRTLELAIWGIDREEESASRLKALLPRVIEGLGP